MWNKPIFATNILAAQLTLCLTRHWLDSDNTKQGRVSDTFNCGSQHLPKQCNAVFYIIAAIHITLTIAFLLLREQVSIPSKNIPQRFTSIAINKHPIFYPSLYDILCIKRTRLVCWPANMPGSHNYTHMGAQLAVYNYRQRKDCRLFAVFLPVCVTICYCKYYELIINGRRY